MVYNTTHKVAQFCNGTYWISMASGAQTGESDPEVGSLIPDKWCTANAGGSGIDCTQDEPGSSPAGTVPGAVQFRGSSAVFAADDANLVWDDTNNRFGIGTATPAMPLSVVRGADNWAANFYGLSTSDTVRIGTLSGVATIGANNNAGNAWADLSINPGGDTYFAASTGNVGIGTTSPEASLMINGGGGVDNTLAFTFTDNEQPASLGGLGEVFGGSMTHNFRVGHRDVAFINRNFSSQAGNQGFTFAQQTGTGTFSTLMMMDGDSGNVGIGTSTPAAAALLDLTSTAKGFLPPRMTTAQVNAIASPPDGLMAYDTDTDTIKLRANGAWVSLSGGGSGSTFTDTGTDSYTTDDIAIGQSSVPETSAALEVESTTKGFLPPRMTTTQRNAISNPAEGLIIYNTSMQQLQYHNGSAWTAIGAVDSPASTTPLVLSWGYSGTVGTLGNGVANATSAYITAVNSPPSNIVAAYGGGYEYGEQGVLCLRTSSNQIYCWGRGEMIGDGDATDELQPKLTATAHSWKSVAVGGNLSNCAINTSDEAYCWGRQDTNGLGNALNNSTNVPNPTGPVGGSGTTWLQLAVGGWYDGSNHRQFVCGIRLSTSEVQCWGNNNEYQLGNGTTTNNYTTTPAAISGSDTFKFITAGNAFACGINSSDKAFCWGRGNEGQQGDGAAADNTVPTAVAGNRSYSMLTAGERFVCGIELGTQHAYCWGQNDDGQIGNASSGVDITSPAAVIGAKQWKSLAAGRRYVCGIDNTDRIFCWGRGDQGAIGNGELLSVSVPTLIYGEYRFAYIAAGATSIVAVTK